MSVYSENYIYQVYISQTLNNIISVSLKDPILSLHGGELSEYEFCNENSMMGKGLKSIFMFIEPIFISVINLMFHRI